MGCTLCEMHGSLRRRCRSMALVVWALLVAPHGVAQDGAAEAGGSGWDRGCLVLDGPEHHEFGSELPFLHVGLGECAALATTVGGDIALVWHVDGEEAGRRAFVPETVRLTMPPALAAGPHEVVVSLRAPGGGGHGDGGGGADERLLDEAVYVFFAPDFRPRIAWEFPPEGYVFKRNSQRFLRFSAHDAGDQQRCQEEGAASCAAPEPFVYYVSYFLNGQVMGKDLRQVYMLGLSSLADGDYEVISICLSVCLSIYLSVCLSVDLSI